MNAIASLRHVTRFANDESDHAPEDRLLAPLEVRNETELAEVARLARGLILQKTSLAQEFPACV